MQTIKRGILMSFDPLTYTASVLIMEATSATINNVPIATHIDGTSARIGAPCAVLFFDENNANDAVILAIYPNGASGYPTPPPGRTTFVSGFRHINSVLINNGTTSTFTLVGSGGIPIGALGVLYKAFYTSPTAGASINLFPTGGIQSDYATIGNLPAANGILNGTGTLPLDSQGRIDIRANGGNCTVTLYTYGYVF